MLSKTLRRAATLGVVALLPLAAATAATAAQHDSLASRLQWRFEVPAGASRILIPGGQQNPYNVCASSGNSGPVSVHYGASATQTLSPGKCQTFETGALSIENLAKAGTAYGTYQREPL